MELTSDRWKRAIWYGAGRISLYHAVLGLPVHEERCAGGAEQLLVTIHGQHAHSARDAPHAQRPPIAGVRRAHAS